MLNRRDFLTTVSGAGLAAAVGDGTTVTSALARAPTRSLQRARIVNTVRGPIDASKLGVSLPHEHVFAASTGFLQTWPEFFGGRAPFANKCVENLRAVKDAGVDTIVDVTPADVGRDIRFLEDVSRRSGMQIVACTGHWLMPSLSMSARSVEELTAFFQLEIERGIERTDIKPGVIKVATESEGVTPFLEKVLRAAARASKATGIPVTTHTHAVSRGGEKQAEIFEAEGLSPASVCLGHSDETDDVSYLTGLAKRGYTIGMDHMPMGLRPPNSGLVPWQKRAETVKQLIDAGYVEKIFLSNDWYFGVSIAGTGAMNAMEQSQSRRYVVYRAEDDSISQGVGSLRSSNPYDDRGKSAALFGRYLAVAAIPPRRAAARRRRTRSGPASRGTHVRARWAPLA